MRADLGLYCLQTVEAFTKHGCRFVLPAHKSPRLVEELKAVRWMEPHTPMPPGSASLLPNGRNNRALTDRERPTVLSRNRSTPVKESALRLSKIGIHKFLGTVE